METLVTLDHSSKAWLTTDDDDDDESETECQYSDDMIHSCLSVLSNRQVYSDCNANTNQPVRRHSDIDTRAARVITASIHVIGRMMG